MKSWQAVVVGGLFVATVAQAQGHPNLDRGFDPEKVYQFGEVDQVSIQSGVVSALLPVSPRYPVGPGLDLGLTAAYSSSIWEYDTVFLPGEQALRAVPSRRSNMGAGFLLTLGIYLDKDDPANRTDRHVFVDSTGSEHEFWPNLHGLENDGDDDNEVDYTRDGSFLKLRRDVASGVHEVDDPSGLTWRFEAIPGVPSYDYRLTEIRDRFKAGNPAVHKNWIRIAYSNPTTSTQEWHITNSQTAGTITVYLSKRRHDPPAGQPNVFMVDRIQFPKFGGGTDDYWFTYVDAALGGFDLLRDCRDVDGHLGLPFKAAMLESIELPDGSTWSMDYWNEETSGNCQRGQLKTLTYPTGGRIEYSYARRRMPTDDGCFDPNASGAEILTIAERKFVDPIGKTPDGSWTYAYFLETDGPNPPNPCEVTDPLGDWAAELMVEVQAPSGHYSRHFFSVWPFLNPSPIGYKRAEYGLPFTRNEPTSGGRFLSSQTFDCTEVPYPCELVRSEYVEYENDGALTGDLNGITQSNRRVKARRTVFHDDANRWTDVAYSSPDGLGHYRTETTSGNFDTANVRTTTTNYNPARGVFGQGGYSPIPASADWLVNLYDFVEVSEEQDGVGGISNEEKSRSELVFDPATGFLQCARTLKLGSARGIADLLVKYGKDDFGNVNVEEYFGGDRQAEDPLDGLLTTGSCADNDDLPAEFRSDHTYSRGRRASSAYAGTGVGFKFLDLDMDPSTGLPSVSRDNAGVPTNLAYDSMGRLDTSEPQALLGLAKDAWTNVTYFQTDGEAPASVQVDRCPPSSGNCNSGNWLTHQYVEFDGFGRPWHEMKEVSEQAQLSTRITHHNAMGWKLRTSSWVLLSQVDPENEAAIKATVFSDFDPFGRAQTITLPDDHVSTIDYGGARRVVTTTNIDLSSTNENESPVTRRELFDRQGRLFSVEEYSNPAQANTYVATEYGYDEGNRLRQVCQYKPTSTSCGQERVFDFDNRGFLRSEKHPEKGPTGLGLVSYSLFDSRGHARFRDDGALARRLEFKHDAAERLEWIKNAGGTTLKAFTYATANTATGAQKGKLKTAQRLNVVGAPLPTDSNVLVTETYTYEGRSGRASKRTTGVTVNGVAAEQWEIPSIAYHALGGVSSLGYAQCTGASCGTGTLTPARSASFTYTDGLLESIGSSFGPWVTDIDYHPSLMIASVRHSNQMVESMGVAAHGMARPDTWEVAGVDDAISSQVYRYDGAGNIKKIGADHFQYDKVSRLDYANLVSVGQTQDYGFDRYGNLTSIMTGSTTDPFPADSTNRLTGGSYDAAGNLTNWNGNIYAYDLFNMMTKLTTASPIETWSYVYTADDERLWALKSDNTRQSWTLRDLGNRLITRDERFPAVGLTALDPAMLALCTFANPIFCNGFESGDISAWSDSSTGIGRKITDYIWRDDKLAGARDSDGATRHFALDHLGTVRLISSDIAETISKPTYFPFGRETVTTTQTPEAMKFTGHERDLQSTSGTADDLDYMHARFSSPTSGRFLSVDPMAGDPIRPQGWNRYSYVQGNPINFIDPTGEILKLAGSAQNQATAEGVANEGLHGVDLVIASDGTSSLVSNQEQGPASPEQSALAETLRSAIDASGTTALSLVSGDTGVVFGNYVSGKVDIGDMKLAGSSNPAGSASLFAHEIAEQQFKQTNALGDSPAGYSRAHPVGIAAQDRVSGYAVDPQSRTRTRNLDGSLSGTTSASHRRGGVTVVVTFKWQNGNLVGVTRQ